VARKKTPIVLNELTRQSAVELQSMVSELTRDTAIKKNDGGKPSRWSRRFAASGKDGIAPKIRLS